MVNEVIDTTANTRTISSHNGNPKAIRSASTDSLGTPRLSTTSLSGWPTTGGLTISVWVNLDNDSTDARHIYTNQVSSRLYFSSNQIYFQVLKTGSTSKTWRYNVTMSDFVNNWKHIFISWDGDYGNNPTLKINNVAVSVAATSGGATGTGMTWGSELHLFDYLSTNVCCELQGSMINFAVWNSSAVSSTTVYNGGVPLISGLPNSGDLIDFWLLGNEVTPSIGESIPTGTTVQSQAGSALNTLTAAEGLSVSSGLKANSRIPERQNFIGGVQTHKQLSALNTHRNGPYGFSTWQQTRISQNPITRYHKKNNQLSFVTRGPLRNIRNDGGDFFIRERNSIIYNYVEPVVTERHYPITWNVGKHLKTRDGRRSPIPQKFSILSSFSNELVPFSNDSVNNLLKYDLDENKTEYPEIIKLYLNDGLNQQDSPLTYWEFLQYRETVWPKMENQFLSKVRTRPQFESFYKHKRLDRNQFFLTSSFGLENIYDPGGIVNEPVVETLTQSTWPLDEDYAFLTRQYGDDSDAIYFQSDATSLNTASVDRDFAWGGRYGEGLLMNTWHQYNFNMSNVSNAINDPAINNDGSGFVSVANRLFSPGPLYSRRISLSSTGALGNPSGMLVPQTGGLTGTTTKLYQGGALWEAGSTRQVRTPRGVYVASEKKPFYNSYSDFAQEIQNKGKNYTVLPEFRISTQFEDLFEANDLFEQDLFEVSGGISGSEDSSKAQFYEIYSNTEFMKNFEIIKEDHEGFTNGTVLSLRCKVLKKFLPYEGFYPCQRTSQLVQKFYDDCNEDIKVYAGAGHEVQDYNLGVQPVYNTLFAPGILFNTIKSGIAVDYPILTSTMKRRSDQRDSQTQYFATASFDQRIPFEAIINPALIANTRIASMEPAIAADLSSSAQFGGRGSEIYSAMASNFFAEVPSFFLQGGNMSSLVSKKQSQIGTLQSGSVYAMRIKMRRSMDRARPLVYHEGNAEFPYSPPQDILVTGNLASRETFTMYSRPSAFGPPTIGITEFHTSSNDPVLFDLEGFNLQGSGSNDVEYQRDSMHGFNFPFTPPYYHGESWCDIIITGSGQEVSLKDLQAQATYQFTRFDQTHITSSGVTVNWSMGPQALANIDANAMQLSASVIVDGLGRAGKRGSGGGSVSGQIIVDSGINEDSRWIIQPKLETPMLNFNHITAEAGLLSVPVYGSESVPRGMWHQYGRIPERRDGVFLEVGPIPRNYQTQVMNKANNEVMKDLSSFLGFNGVSTKLGKIAKKKEISEAVVAVPFIKEGGRRKFFKLDEQKIRSYKNGNLESLTQGAAESQIGRSVLLQLRKMEKFVMPPSFDFLKFGGIDPIAMYIFEFKHTLNQQDLADIWQNLPPTIGETMEEAEVAITHPLLKKELLGSGGEAGNDSIDLPSRLQWMVFKVKQRASSNYFKKVVKSNFDLNTDPESATADVDEFGSTSDFQFNWPYDYFSIIEMAKIDAEVEIGNADFSNYTDNIPEWSAVTADPAAWVAQNADPSDATFEIDMSAATELDNVLEQEAFEEQAEEYVEATEQFNENQEALANTVEEQQESAQLAAEIEMQVVDQAAAQAAQLMDVVREAGGAPASGLVGGYASALASGPGAFFDTFVGGSGPFMPIDQEEFGFDLLGAATQQMVGMLSQGSPTEEFTQGGGLSFNALYQVAGSVDGANVANQGGNPLGTIQFDADATELATTFDQGSSFNMGSLIPFF